MIELNCLIEKHGEKGEKTGWTYVIIIAKIADKLKSGNKKGFRVKGKLDNVVIKQLALLPIGEGDFMMPLNAPLLKKLGKRRGEPLHLQLEEDKSEKILSPDLMACIADDNEAMAHFKKLSPSHQHYYSDWIKSAKTEETKVKRIAQALNGLAKGLHYGEMMRDLKGKPF